VVLAVGDFLDRYVLITIGIRLQLVDIQYEHISLDLIRLLEQPYRQ
jgi:hypothetical protein